MSAIVVIPARLASTRLPGKVLVDLNGRPLLWYVWHQVCQAQQVSAVYVATDSPEVQAAVEGWGGQAFMTSPACRSGSERISSILPHLEADLIVNVQGDEPMVDPVMLDSLIGQWHADPCDLVTPVYPLTDLADLHNPNVVKVVRTRQGRALYFSRSPIPFVRDVPVDQWLQQPVFWGHVGIYGYRREVLAKYPDLPVSLLESVERLEQLRFLEAGYQIQTVETNYRSIAVDTPADLERVRGILAGTLLG